MEKIGRETPDLTQENIAKIAALFPDVVTEATDADGNIRLAIDFDALRDDLSGEVVDGPRERYQFTWPGKREAKLEARRPIKKTMRPCPEKSKDWDTTENLYIEGDNLEALKIMRETYAGKVKLIYIDPPYNTGHDFVYDDDFSKTRAEYDAESGEYDEEGGRLVANPESNGRFHSDWCSMMYPRLMLARDLLSDDGAIFISISDAESRNMRNLCDEIYGPESFIAMISWQNNTSPRNDAKGIPYVTDNILAYSRTPLWQPRPLPRTDEMNSRYESPDNDPTPWTSGPYHAPDSKNHRKMVYAVQHPFTGELIYPPAGRHWAREQTKVLSLMNEWAPYKLQSINDADVRANLCGVPSGEVPEVPAVILATPPRESENSRHKTSRRWLLA